MSYNISSNLVLVDSKDGVYAYNSIFGGLKKLSLLEVETLNRIRNGTPVDLDSVLEGLIGHKFVLHNGYDDQSEMLSIIDGYRERIISGKSITKLLLMVTEKCMLACKYCYVPDAPGNNTYTKCEDMTWDIAKKAINAFSEIVQTNGQKNVHIRFHGGEPLLNFELIKKAILYTETLFVEYNVSFHINSNGIVMNDAIAKFLSEHNVDLEISLDGTEETHNKTRIFPNGRGSFNYAVKAIDTLKKYNPLLTNINFSVTLNRLNCSDLNAIVDLAYEKGVKEIEVNTLLFEHPLDILDDIDTRVRCLIEMRKYGVRKGIKISGKWFKLFERLNNPVINYCGRMGQQIGVDYKGDVFLCTGYMKRFGKVENWREIIKQHDYTDICMRVLGNIPECNNCSVQGLCAGGCTASVAKSYGNFDYSERKECEFRKKMVKELIKNIGCISSEDVSIDSVDSSYVPTIG